MQRSAHVVVPGAVAALAAAEWLNGVAPAWAWLAAAAGAGAVVGVVVQAARARRRPAAPPLLAALAAAVLGGTLVVGAVKVRRIECCWAELRERRLTRASLALGATLDRATAEARRLADRAAAAAALPAVDAFAHLERALEQGARDLERGVLIRTEAGRPWAWAGRHRFLPAGRRDTAELAAAITPFYVTLEARRQTPDGRTAVGHVLLHAADEVPDRERALGVAFARTHGVDLRFFPSSGAPAGDVLDFCVGGCEPDSTAAEPLPVDTLFSVMAEPPGQGAAKREAERSAAQLGGTALLALLAFLLVAASAGRARWTVLALGGWTLARAASGQALPGELFFSPTTFFRPALGMFSESAGALAGLGALVIIAAAALWRRGLARRWWTAGLAALLVLAAPYLLRYFGRGITPPASGVGLALWLSWQAALAAGGMGVVLLAAALVRGRDEPARVPWPIPAAGAWAVLAGAVGLWLWSPAGAWPEWYTFAWLPALAGVLVPAPRRWALVGTATVAGTAAALLTWSAALEGRLSLAQRDVLRLGRVGDPVVAALLEQVGDRQFPIPPASPAELYALWLHSPLTAYPTVLALWSGRNELVAELRLADLDLPTPHLAELVRSADRAAGLRIHRLERAPGVHYVLVAPLASGEVLTVGVGPQSALVPPDRVARFLRGDVSRDPPYTIALSLPSPEPVTETLVLAWSRSGWSARGERRLAMPDSVRHVHARVDLGHPLGLVARGTLVVAADLALLVLLWLLARFVAEGWRPRLPPVLGVLRASYRARLAAALATFFVLPVLTFALWSITRLADEARRAGDLLIRQTVRDAEATMGADLELGLDAELWLYRDGVLAAASTPVLAELGLVERLLEPDVYRRLVLEDETDLTADASTAGRPVRVGYRLVRVGPAGSHAVLAAPQLLDDERVRREQEDLALALALATLAGLVAAVSLAGVAARELARPVAALRDAALAVGRGAPAPALQRGAPQEFEPVFSAFERMATDVRESREALEEARRRTAQVLANVATGVIALDGELRVTIANPRAEALLGVRLETGRPVAATAPAPWGPVWDAVGAFLRGRLSAGDIAEREFDVDGRQIRVQVAPLGPRPDGTVVAIDDATELTRAARILAWGEMARQVAHEIKNPLTPIRLGIQHLQRVRRKGDFEATLAETSQRILAEIDRLDAIARAFSRFGAPAAQVEPLEPVDLFRTAQDVVQLYALGHVRPRFAVEGQPGPPVRARQADVKEVLVNLLENARHAEPERVVVRVVTGAAGEQRLVVEDDGRGIPADVLSRVFEPAFSTTSSGSGLGLPIARRLVESWGGTIEITSREGRGTVVVITFGPGAAAR